MNTIIIHYYNKDTGTVSYTVKTINGLDVETLEEDMINHFREEKNIKDIQIISLFVLPEGEYKQLTDKIYQLKTL